MWLFATATCSGEYNTPDTARPPTRLFRWRCRTWRGCSPLLPWHSFFIKNHGNRHSFIQGALPKQRGSGSSDYGLAGRSLLITHYSFVGQPGIPNAPRLAVSAALSHSELPWGVYALTNVFLAPCGRISILKKNFPDLSVVKK